MTENQFDPSPATFQSIYQAVSETARGRWFLDELAKRNRTSDTEQVLMEIATLKKGLLDAPADDRLMILVKELEEMRNVIQAAQQRIPSVEPTQSRSKKNGPPAPDPDIMEISKERATSEMLASAGQLRVMVDHMRRNKTDEELTVKLDKLSSDIITSCTIQGVSDQHTTKLAITLQYLEKRVNTMIQILNSTKDFDGSELLSPLAPADTDTQNPEPRNALGGGTGLNKFDDELDGDREADIGLDHLVQSPSTKAEKATAAATGAGQDTMEETDSNVYPLTRDDEKSASTELSDGKIDNAQAEKSQG